MDRINYSVLNFKFTGYFIILVSSIEMIFCFQKKRPKKTVLHVFNAPIVDFMVY